MKFSLAVLLCATSASAFQAGFLRRSSFVLRASANDVNRADAVARLEKAAKVSEVMSKSYEDKLKAVEAVEAENQKEIDALTAKIEAIRSKPAASAPPKITDPSQMTNEELQDTLRSLESFISESEAPTSVAPFASAPVAAVAPAPAPVMVAPGGSAAMAVPPAQAGLSGVDLFSITGAAALTSAAVSGALDNSRRDSFGSIVAGMSAPIVASVTKEKPEPVPVVPAAPSPKAVDMSKFQVRC